MRTRRARPCWGGRTAEPSLDDSRLLRTLNLTGAVKWAQGDDRAYFLRGTLHHDEDPERALRDYTRAVELNSGHASAYFLRAELRRKRGDSKGAAGAGGGASGVAARAQCAAAPR